MAERGLRTGPKNETVASYGSYEKEGFPQEARGVLAGLGGNLRRGRR